MESYIKNQSIAVIPCLNEQKTIYDIIVNTLNYVGKVIVVNDGSWDRTKEEAIRAGAVVVDHSINMGKGAAVNTAFLFLRGVDCQAVVFLDGDGQHNPHEIPRILEKIITEKADMVIGSRFINGSGQIPAYRKLGLNILNIVTNFGSKVKVTDSQCGFRGFSRKAINIMRFSEKGLSVESEMQFIAGKNGLKVMEVPISTIYDGKPRRSPISHGLGVLFRVIRLYYR